MNSLRRTRKKNKSQKLMIRTKKINNNIMVNLIQLQYLAKHKSLTINKVCDILTHMKKTF